MGFSSYYDNSASNQQHTMRLMATTTLCAAIVSVSYYMYSKHFSASSEGAKDSKKKSDSCCSGDAAAACTTEKDMAPSLSAEETAKIFGAIVAQMGNVMMQLAKIETQVRTESQQTGTVIPEEQLMQYLAQNFQESLEKVSSSIYSLHKVSEAEVEKAGEYYAEEPSVKSAVSRLVQLINIATGQGGEVASPDLFTVPEEVSSATPIPMELMLQMLEETFMIMGDVMEKTCADIIAEGIPKEKIGETLQMRYTQQADAASAGVFAKFEVSRESFQHTTIKYSKDPTFIAKMQTLQQEQDVRFQKAAQGLHLE